MFRVSDAKRFENLTSGLRNLAVAAGLLLGGAWTVWTFNALGVRTRADAELFEQATVDITVTAVQEVVDDTALYIAARATVSNSGNRNTLLDFTSISPWIVSRIEYDPNRNGFGSPDANKKIDYGTLYSSHRVLRRTESASYPLFVRVDEPGLYLVRFRVPLSERELEIHNTTAEELGAPAAVGTVTWTGFAHVVVREINASSSIGIN